jgi:integrase
MGLYRRGKVWWYSFMYEGHRYQGSLKTDNKRIADKQYARIVADIVEGKHFGFTRITMKEVLERYMNDVSALKAPATYTRDQQIVNHFYEFFGNLQLKQVTPSLVSKYKSQRLKKVSPTTVRIELSFLRRVFNTAINEWELCKENPVTRIFKTLPPETKRVRFLKPDEAGRLRFTLPEWLRPIVIVACQTGLRRGNIVNLQVSQVDFSNNLILVGKTKNGEPVCIPMTQLVRETIRDVIKGRKIISPYVFCDEAGDPYSKEQVSMAFSRAVKRAGIKDLRFHDLRHDFATSLVRSGVDLYRVQKLLNHKDQRMTQRYAHLLIEDLRDAVSKFDEGNTATILLQSEEIRQVSNE